MRFQSNARVNAVCCLNKFFNKKLINSCNDGSQF